MCPVCCEVILLKLWMAREHTWRSYAFWVVAMIAANRDLPLSQLSRALYSEEESLHETILKVGLKLYFMPQSLSDEHFRLRWSYGWLRMGIWGCWQHLLFDSVVFMALATYSCRATVSSRISLHSVVELYEKNRNFLTTKCSTIVLDIVVPRLGPRLYLVQLCYIQSSLEATKKNRVHASVLVAHCNHF